MKGRIYIYPVLLQVCLQSVIPSQALSTMIHTFGANQPPTWGICRTDFRSILDRGDYIFFVLPKNARDVSGNNLPQMIYGFFRIARHINHLKAYEEYPTKRMRNANPNGNIIVNQNGLYNLFDLGIHKDHFNEFKEHYIVGDQSESEFLKPSKIKRLAPKFIETLNNTFKTQSNDVFEIISRKGRILDDKQIMVLLHFLKEL